MTEGNRRRTGYQEEKEQGGERSKRKGERSKGERTEGNRMRT